MTPTISLLRHTLTRVDLWLARALRRAELMNTNAEEQSNGGLFVTHTQAVTQLYRTGQDDPLDDESSILSAIAEAKTGAQQLDSALRADGVTTTPETLATLFGLTDFELDAFLIALAPALEPRYSVLYGYLQDDVTAKLPRVSFILELLCGTSLDRLAFLHFLSESGRLRQLGLLESAASSGGSYYGNALLHEPLQVEPALVQWLLGIPQFHRSIQPYARLIPLQSNDEGDTARDGELERILDAAQEHNALLSLYGSDEQAQEQTAAHLAQREGKPLLEFDVARAIRNGGEGISLTRLALRDAQLHNALPAFLHWSEEWVTPEIAELVMEFPAPVVVRSTGRWHGYHGARTRPILSHLCTHPGYGERLRLWKKALPLETAAPVETVAGQFTLTRGQIRQAAATARDYALQRGSLLDSNDLIAAARFHSTPRLGTLAYQIHPRFEWDDIVLPAEQKNVLREIINMVRGRGVVLEEWGLGQKLVSSSGVSALFAGPPGTGKTMAAEVIAGELGLDLYKIDLSSVVNKYIGETEKSLGKLFDEASASNSILFFDEADALFGKRSEVKDSHDRYANIEVSYLLQRMEQYDGVTVLATNLRSSMDEAFTRRLQFAIDFPFPEEHDRLRLWQTLLPPQVPVDASVNLALLARRFKMAGGSIRNVIVSAAHIAAANGRVVTQAHLLHGVRRELQKMGRLVDERDMKVE